MPRKTPAPASPNSTPGGAAPAVWLVDNGSLEPAATLSLRGVAARLAVASGYPVRPVSLLHSSTIAPAELGGQAAEIFEPTLKRVAAEGLRNVLVVPLFLGPSAAIAEYLPERVRDLRETWTDLQVRVAPCLVDASNAKDARVAEMLAEQASQAAVNAGYANYAVAVVDHGTPQHAVNAVRELVAAQLGKILGDSVRAVATCSMERRSGAEFDFNEPLLEKLLDAPEFNTGEVVVAKLFLQPGRHAGPGGDVEQIGRAAQGRHPGLKVAYTEPLASHPGLGAILAERLEQGLRVPPVA